MTPALPDELASVVIERLGDRVYARLAGEIDMSNADSVGDQLRNASQGVTEMVVDLAGISFLDSSALRALVGLRNELQAGGRSLVVTTPAGSRAARLLALSGVDRALDARYESDQHAVPDPRG